MNPRLLRRQARALAEQGGQMAAILDDLAAIKDHLGIVDEDESETESTTDSGDKSPAAPAKRKPGRPPKNGGA